MIAKREKAWCDYRVASGEAWAKSAIQPYLRLRNGHFAVWALVEGECHCNSHCNASEQRARTRVCHVITGVPPGGTCHFLTTGPGMQGASWDVLVLE